MFRFYTRGLISFLPINLIYCAKIYRFVTVKYTRVVEERVNVRKEHLEEFTPRAHREVRMERKLIKNKLKSIKLDQVN